MIKRIIKKRLRDQLIAEKKRLFYVAVTRAMDHLVLIGHFDFSSRTLLERVSFSPMDNLTSWMDWLNRILDLPLQATASYGEIIYSNEAGTPLVIPYRKYTGGSAFSDAEAEYRTDFPLV